MKKDYGHLPGYPAYPESTLTGPWRKANQLQNPIQNGNEQQKFGEPYPIFHCGL